MFEVLTFTERRSLVRTLRSGIASCRYEAGQLRRDPHAVCYEGESLADYLNLTDSLQALVDDVQAIDLARGL